MRNAEGQQCAASTKRLGATALDQKAAGSQGLRFIVLLLGRHLLALLVGET